jgi:hypothetical protein
MHEGVSMQHLDAERGAARQLKHGADIDERVRQPPRPRSFTPAILSEARMALSDSRRSSTSSAPSPDVGG